jgi:hypothetical protein
MQKLTALYFHYFLVAPDQSALMRRDAGADSATNKLARFPGYLAADRNAARNADRNAARKLCGFRHIRRQFMNYATRPAQVQEGYGLAASHD